MSGKPIPKEDRLPWYISAAWIIWGEWITWPLQARRLKRAGFRRTGWRTWEYP